MDNDPAPHNKSLPQAGMGRDRARIPDCCARCFLGLQASNWNETRQLSAREAVLKDQLISDVNLILDETRAKITHLEKSETDLEWLMDAFSQPEVSLTEDGFEEHPNI